jgi:hypothetical protein
MEKETSIYHTRKLLIHSSKTKMICNSRKYGEFFYPTTSLTITGANNKLFGIELKRIDK